MLGDLNNQAGKRRQLAHGHRRLTMQRRTTIQISAFVLAIVVVFNSARPALLALELPEGVPAESAEQKKAARAKVEVTRRGVGHKARVRVKLQDKHELKGVITHIDEDSFQVLVDADGLDPQSAQDRLITIRYSEVEKVRGPRSRAASIAIGVGMTIATIAALAVIVYAEIHKHDPLLLVAQNS
jgi:small nuclear ribonucleoprotein (snRNP)-like protein